MPQSRRSLIGLISKNLYEQDEQDDQDDNLNPQDDQENQVSQKEKEKQSKNISDIDKDDLEQDDEFDESDVAVSLKLNDNTKTGGGKIKLVTFKRLTTLTKIEDILELLNVPTQNIQGVFEDQLEITIGSPLSDFKDQQYIVRLMDGAGEIAIYRGEGFNSTITKHGTGSPSSDLGSAAQQGLEGEETPEKQIDLSYLPALNYEFQQAVKDEFFNRILAKGE